MTVLFRPDIVLPRDPAGFGQWRIGHYLDHRQLAVFAAKLTKPVFVPDYDVGYWDDAPSVVTSWLNRHYEMHILLRQPGSIQGIDLSAVDLSDDDQWFVWLDSHRLEHQELNQFYGLT